MRFIFLLLALVLVSSPARGEPSATVVSSANQMREICAQVVPAESLRLTGSGGPPGRLELSEMAKLEVSRGMKSNAGTGALIGMGVGLVGGIVAGILFRPENDDYGLGAMSIAMSTFVGATAICAVTGAFIKTEKWQELPIPDGR